MSKLAIIGGIAGVGKTTVLNVFYEKLKAKNVDFETFVYGTVMLNEAEKAGIKDRDQMRNLPYEKQVELQKSAAKRIASSKSYLKVVDTHFQIPTPFGYLPGIPMHVARILKPTHLFLITAPAELIIKRRMNDPTRKREIIPLEKVEEEIEYSRMYMISVSNITGALASEVVNEEGKPEATAEELIKRLEL
ncbi:MAG: adenylate kinase [Nitrososphaeria archaeon]|nr:adenylate kinase [TACK group archaeon]